MTSKHNPDSCFTDFALQEYVYGRLAEDVRRELELHVVDCGACSDAIKLLNSERDLLRNVATIPARPAEQKRPDWITLAAYMDGALDPEDATRLESDLLTDSALLELLIRLQREVDAVLHGPDDVVAREASPPSPGQTIRMPRRTKMPPLVMPQNLRFGGGQPG